ncbi:MAG: hypothetical protein L0207_03370 [Chlamydiae bacterium]|nr:hypothetical protein [Chlamydiota bacterium]
MSFNELLQKEKIPNVLLLEGPNLLSQAKEIAGKLMGPAHQRKIASENHPDLFIYQIKEKSGLHSIASLRHLIEQIGLSPLEANVKVFIIDSAEKMLPSGANALLKTLEEPPNDSYILLLTEDSSFLLPTIGSRCTKISYEANQSSEDLSEIKEHITQLFHSLSDELSLLEGITKLEKQFFNDPEKTQEYFHRIDLLFQSILSWFRDIQIISFTENMSSNYLHNLGKIDALIGYRAPSMEKINRLIKKSYFALERNMKLRTVILNFFLQI